MSDLPKWIERLSKEQLEAVRTVCAVAFNGDKVRSGASYRAPYNANYAHFCASELVSVYQMISGHCGYVLKSEDKECQTYSLKKSRIAITKTIKALEEKRDTITDEIAEIEGE